MKSVRLYFTALGLVMAVIASTSLSAFGGAAHAICTAQHHDCGQQETIKPCCCGAAGSPSNPSGPITAQITGTGTQTPVATVFAAVAPTLTPTTIRAEASRPRAAPVDLPTLFASLLI